MCSYEKRIKHMKRKQSTITYSELVSHSTLGKVANTKIMVPSFSVSYFLVTYLRIVSD